MSDEEIAVKALKKKRKKNISVKDLLSSGSTLFNLASTGRIAGCWIKGYYYWFVGDSDSGKTFFVLTTLAEACINPEFADYDIIYDGSEEGALMDMEEFFGPEMARRIEPPYGTKEDPMPSRLTEEFYFNVDNRLKSGRPFIYILDSMDGLDTKDDEKKFEDHKKAFEKRRAGKKGKKEAGSFGMSKASINSRYIRRMASRLKDSGSILIVISQTRDNVGPFAQYDPKTAAGGRALKFYATLQVWTSLKMKLKKLVRGKQRQQGILVKLRLRKNRIKGRDTTVEVPIYWSVGIDDIGSCVDFLITEGHWKKGQGGIKAKEFEVSKDKEALIQFIQEDPDREAELKRIVKRVWGEIEEELKVVRKSKYHPADSD